MHKALSTVLVYTIVCALKMLGCKPRLVVCLSLCLIGCTLLGLNVQAAHSDLLLELLHTASMAHTGYINRHTKALSPSMPVFAYAL